MAQFDRDMTGKAPALEGDQWGRRDLKPKAYQEMKSSLHRDLLSRIDLEKLNYLDDNHARNQIYAVIQDLVAHSNIPLSAAERERLLGRCLGQARPAMQQQRAAAHGGAGARARGPPPPSSCRRRCAAGSRRSSTTSSASRRTPRS